MIYFFQKSSGDIIAVGTNQEVDEKEIEILTWLFSEAQLVKDHSLSGKFVGPRKEMVSPWSTNATDIVHNAGIGHIQRIETYFKESNSSNFDPMLQQRFDQLDQSLFKLDRVPEIIKHIENIADYNDQEGLALSEEEISYLEGVAKEIGRPLTDSEVFGFSQINSEHGRHKIFNGTFIIDQS